MKKIAILILAGLFITTGGSIFAQKLKSGSFSALKGQTEVNLQYDYSNMAVGKYKKEEDSDWASAKDLYQYGTNRPKELGTIQLSKAQKYSCRSVIIKEKNKKNC